MTTTTEEVRCTLSEAARQARREALRGGFLRRIEAVRELSDGIALQLPLAAESEAREFIAFERECCGFAGFELKRRDGRLALEIHGPEGTKDFVRQLLPEGLDVTPAGDTPTDGRWLHAGLGGAAAALFALVCCGTPILGLVLGAIGLASASGAVAFWTDAIAAPVLLGSLALVAWAWVRRRRPGEPAAAAGCCEP